MTDYLRHQKIEIVPLRELHGYERNARTHSAGQIRQLTEAIAAFGFTNPLLIDETGMIIAGHGRAAAAKEMALKDVPCIRVTGLTESQKRALIISDNKIALNAGWDDKMLAEELKAIAFDIDAGDLDFTLGAIGFDLPEVDELLKVLEETEEEEAPSTIEVEPEPVVCRQGETWILGNHRLTIGGKQAPRDADMLIRAWERETQEEAQLSGNGETFTARAKSLGIEFVRPQIKSQKARTKKAG